MATDWSNFAPVDTAPADSSVKWDNFEPANAEEKARLGEEMKSLRRERKLGNAEEAAIKGAEFFTQGVSKMFPTSAIGGVMDALGVQPPIPAEHVRQAREFLSGLPARAEIPADVPTVGPAFDPGIEKGVNQFVDEMVSGLTRPDQVALLAASGKFPTEVARTFQLAPVVEAPQQIQQIQQASEAGDVPGTVKGIAGLTAGALLPSAIEAGINKPTAKTKGKPNARPISEPATLYGDVQPLAQPAEVVPTEEGVRGIQPEASGGIPATTEPAQSARPREENQVPLSGPSIKLGAVDTFIKQGEALVNQMADQVAQGLPVDQLRKIVEQNGNWKPADVDAFINKVESEVAKRKAPPTEVSSPIPGDVPPATTLAPTMETARAVATMTPDEFYQKASTFNKINLEIGQKATPAEYAELKQLRDKANERLKDKLAEVAVDPSDSKVEKYAKANNLPIETVADKDVARKALRDEMLNDLGKVGSMPQFYNEAIKAYEESHPAAPAVESAKAPEPVKPVEAAKPVHKMEVFRGSGRGNKQSVYTFGIDEPVLGKGNYYALDEKTAKKYGPNVEKQSVSFSNPLKISSDEDYVNLVRGAGIKYAKFWQTSPEKIKSALQDAHSKIRKYLADNGYDAVVVKVGDIHNQVLDDVFSHDQVFIPEKSEGAKPEPIKANGKKAPASKQAELTFEEQKAEQAELNKAQGEPRSYTSATEDESGRLYLNPIGPLIRTTLSDIRDFSHGVKKSAEWIIEKGREAAGLTKEAAKEGFNVGGKMNDYRRSVLNWSMKLQKSFGEAAHAQRDIQKRVPDSLRREAITNWIQADGDNTVLANRAATTTDKRLKKGYEIAQKLTPDEIAIARQIKGVYDALGQRGQAYGVINNFKENYVTQIWNLKNRLGGSARTLKDKFKYAKARTFDSFYDGEQAGYDPKTKDISKLLPSYLHEMNSVIAARQLVKQMQNGVAADGRPLLVPRGTGTPVSGPTGDATLITPKAVKGDTSDYKLLPNQPALNDWVWAAKDQAGNNIFLKADLMVHPKVYDKLKNTLGRSAIQEWYKSDTGPAAMLPKAIVQGLDVANNEAKRTMLGLASPFHQVQEGTHAVGHRVNPFSVPEIDLVGNPEQADAAKHGVMLLPDRASESQFMEGFRASGLVSRIPIIGRIADAYSNYLFHDYIPGLKFKTYQAILERNKSVFAKELANGTATLEDVKVLSAEQSNAAYGHLNYADLGRNPTISHIMRATIIAPDFLEARARFAGQAAKGATGFKVGREQVLALGFLALTQATAAYIIAKSLNGEWDKSHPFEFTKDNKRYTMRSVPEDVTSLIDNPRMFFNNRMTALASTLDQLRTGRDWKGDRISASDTLKEASQKPLPLPIRAALKMGSKSLSAIEQLAGSFGIKISAADPKIKKGIEIKDRTELLANKLRKLNRVERYKTAKDELKDLPPKDRNTVIDKLRRQGVFTYQ